VFRRELQNKQSKRYKNLIDLLWYRVFNLITEWRRTLPHQDHGSQHEPSFIILSFLSEKLLALFIMLLY